MAILTPISIDEYLHTSYRPDCDYVDGIVVERNVGEKDHSTVQRKLILFLGNRQTEWGILVYPEQRVQVKPNRFSVPDVCVVRADAPDEQILTHPPLLCIEILSPDDRMSQMLDRVKDYLDLGVPSVWVIDPQTRRAQIYTSGAAREVLDGTLRAQMNIAVPLRELFD